MWVSHVLHDWHATLSIYLRFVSASRLMRRLKRGVLGADALLRAAEASWLQTLARSSCSSDWVNGPSASNSFPARPRVRPLTYLGLPWESSATVRAKARVRVRARARARVIGSGLGLGLGC